MEKATGNGQQAAVRRPAPNEVIAAAAKATGIGNPSALFMCSKHDGRLFVSRSLSAARRAAASILLDQERSLPEIAEALGYASPSGPSSLLARPATRFEQRVEREARAALGVAPAHQEAAS